MELARKGKKVKNFTNVDRCRIERERTNKTGFLDGRKAARRDIQKKPQIFPDKSPFSVSGYKRRKCFLVR